MLFFGDNGQGDLMCAERLTGMNGSPSEDGVGGMVSAAFIHQARDLLHPDFRPCIYDDYEVIFILQGPPKGHCPLQHFVSKRR